LRDESANWAHGGAAMARINSNRCVVLERAVEGVVMLVQPTGSDVHKYALYLPARIRKVMAHGIRHGAAVTLAAAHRLQSEVDLHAMEHGFLS
jgi:hypothetical protein